MRALGPVLMILIVYALFITWMYFGLRAKQKASKDPLLVLPKKDRIEYARELLDRQQEEYEEAKTARLEQSIKGYLSPGQPTHERNAVETRP